MVKQTTTKHLRVNVLVVILHKFINGTSINCITLKFKTMKQIYRNILLLVIMGAALVGCSKKIENPKPSVAIVTEEGYTSGEKHLFTGSTLKFGFNATANAETNKKLVKFRVFISNGRSIIYDNVFELNNEDNYHCEDEFCFVELGDWQIVGRAFDADNEEESAYINIHVQEDMEFSFTWQQVGQDTVVGFNDYGLLWCDTKLIDSVSVALDTIHLLPAGELISLYLFDKSKWDEIDTYDGKAALFKDIKKNPKNYKDNKINAFDIYAAKEAVTYDNVIAILNENEDGENLLLLISNSFSENYSDNGLRHLTVNGKLK